MKEGAPRVGLSIFRRTFLLLLAALVVAQGVAVTLLLHSPIRSDSTELMQVVALLSSRMPSGDSALHTYTTEAPPAVPAGKDFRTDTTVQTWIARWLDVDVDSVMFASARRVHLRGGPPGHAPGERPFGRGPPPPLPDCVDCGSPPISPPEPPDFGPDDPSGLGDRPPPGHELAPDTPLRGDFIAAVRQPDGHWRAVESTQRSTLNRVGKQAGLLFLLGLLVLLPIALWFSRALSAPIREFAKAADHLGRNPGAPPLPGHGPQEIALAADSFNTMQARLNRMIAERTQMVGAIAHDLRTPLARLAFRLDKLPQEEQEKAQADIDEMKAMISAALDFLRDQSQVGPRERIDFRSLVESVVDGLADTGADAMLEPGEPVTVSGDPIALRRVVVNLTDNALKYGQRARLRLQLSKNECRLEIDDDGPGIDPAQANQLFLPFFRGEASRNRDTGGIGLGLSTVQSILASHGGEISLTNRPERGLRATVILPAR